MINDVKCGTCLNEMQPVWDDKEKLTAWHCDTCNREGAAVGREFQITRSLWEKGNGKEA